MRLNTIFLLDKVCLISKKMRKLFIIGPLALTLLRGIAQLGFAEVLAHPIARKSKTHFKSIN